MDIAPDKQNIDTLFSSTQYNIDFYQREYKWNNEPVKRLLDDIYYKFNEVYQKKSSIPADAKIVDSEYPWYYLNTYVTNTVNGEVYVVDGQQRLTTLTLILLNLYHLLQAVQSKLSRWVDAKICGQNGYESSFWMNHLAHIDTIQALYDGNVDSAPIESGLTALNMVKNYKVISDWFDDNFGDDKNKLETFTFYFLKRLVLINLSVEQTDVPMVFEVINDRGVKLKPYEILKGKLLGQLDKVLLDNKNYNGLWEEKLRQINKFSEDEADKFFRTYLKARFADSKAEAQKFDGDYHRIMFSNSFQEKLKIDHNKEGVIKFLEQDFSYYADLYVKLLTRLNNDKDSYFTFSRLNDLDGVLLLGISICEIKEKNEKDKNEDAKINTIAKEFDRIFSLLQLQKAYESNNFQELLYQLSSKVRNQPLENIRDIFDSEITKQLSNRIQHEVISPFEYSLFKNTGENLNTRFKRYFFARVEGFLADELKTSMRQTYDDLVTKTGSVTGFHIEHILSHNDESLSHFNGDEELFLLERNRLGGILLLKGKDNISSSNELYVNKLQTYAGTLLWNETLREDFYKSNLDFQNFREKYKLDELQGMNKFNRESLETRQKILFKIALQIWS